jgi:hypothetical protein
MPMNNLLTSIIQRTFLRMPHSPCPRQRTTCLEALIFFCVCAVKFYPKKHTLPEFFVRVLLMVLTQRCIQQCPAVRNLLNRVSGILSFPKSNEKIGKRWAESKSWKEFLIMPRGPITLASCLAEGSLAC